MKKLAILFYIFFHLIYCYGKEIQSIPIPSHFYVNNGRTDFSQIFKRNYELFKTIEELFNTDRLDHELTRAYDLNATFSNYWNKNKLFWFECDLNKDNVNELIFTDYSINKKPIDCITEIYYKSKVGYKLIYKEVGIFISFKIQSNTREIILFHHRFPCCSSMSNNLDQLRIIRGQVKMRRKYFVASEKKNLNSTFPKYVKYSSIFHILQKEQVVYWERNLNSGICLFPKNSAYKVLAKMNGWKYIEMFEFPIKSDRISPLINIDNFQAIHIYGWIK